MPMKKTRPDWLVSLLAIIVVAVVCVVPLVALSSKWGFGGVLIWWGVMWCIVKARELWAVRKAKQARREKKLIYGGPPLRYRNGRLDTYWYDRTYNP